MLKRIISIYAAVSLIAFTLSFSAVFAKDKNDDSQVLPTEEGTYDVPGRPMEKLHVSIYKAKSAPAPVTPPSEICSLPDDNSSASTPGWAKWKLPANWTYTLNPSSVPSTVGGAYLSVMADDAFNRWSSASNGLVKLARTSSYTASTRAVRDGQNIIAWGRTSGGALAVTYTWYNQATGQVLENDTIMNLKFTWYWSNPASWITSASTTCAYVGAYDAQDILTHELGHWFGLNDHYTGDFINSTMYGYGATGETKKNTLTEGDIAGIRAIYK